MSKINNLPEELIELVYNNCNKIIKLSDDDINYCVNCNFPLCKHYASFKMKDIIYWLNY